MMRNGVNFRGPHGAKINYDPGLSYIGKTFAAILLIVVFEGAFRKWISQSFTTPLVLARDLLALSGILWGIKKNLLNLNSAVVQLVAIWTVLVISWGLLQLIINQTQPVTFIIGLRFWLLYFLFACVSAVGFNLADFKFVGKLFIFLLLLMTPLAVLQHFSPPSSLFNRQVDGDEATVFRLTADIVRTTGTFSFTLGYTVFIAITTPFVFYILRQNVLWGKRWPGPLFVVLLGIATAVSGSRGAVIFFGLSLAAYIFISIIYSKGARRSSTLLMLIVVMMALTIIPLFFSRAIDATEERFETAAASENFAERVVTIFIGERDFYAKTSFLGSGIGAGTNVAGFLATGQRTFLLAETETARTILEAGLLGVFYVFLKCLLILYGVRRSVSIARASGNSLPLLLWLTTALALLTWSIIGQLSVNALGWLLFGLASASVRLFSGRPGK